jgi:hypothetical protein
MLLQNYSPAMGAKASSSEIMDGRALTCSYESELQYGGFPAA